MEKVFKTKDEYCHIYSDRIVISRTPEVGDLVADYSKSINTLFKSLMLFFVFIPLCTGLSVMLYLNGNYGISVYAGSFALFFLSMAFYLILFTSSSPVIYKDKIVIVKFKKTIQSNIIEIRYRDFGRMKKRGLIFNNDQVDEALKVLLDEGLIEDLNIENFGSKIEWFYYTFMAILGASLFYSFMNSSFIDVSGNKGLSIMTSYGIIMIMIMISTVIISIIIRNLVSSYFCNNKKRKRE